MMRATMLRDPQILAECHALARAIQPFPTIESLHGCALWRELQPRFAALLGTVRLHEPPGEVGAALHANRVRVVQWNIEHGNWYDQVERALLGHEALAHADIVTLDEVDLGCARAGNRDVTADLCRALGLHGVWAPLFLETTEGRDDDLRMAAGRENEEGLFGITVLSRWPIGEVRIVELPSPQKLQFDLERMSGVIAR